MSKEQKTLVVVLLVAIITLPVAAFGVYFLLQRQVVAALVCLGYLLAAIAFAVWIIATLRREASDTSEPRKTFTVPEIVGHSGMAILLVATGIATAITGDWFYAAMGAAWLVNGFVRLAVRARKRRRVSVKELVDLFL